MKPQITPFDFDLNRRTLDSIAQGALTNSKRPECHVKGAYPTHTKGGQGALLIDSKGKQYIDYICGLGSNILGYGHAEWAEAVSTQLRKGATFSLSSELEIQMAEKISEIVPFVEKVKFLKTGSEACSAAIRIARTLNGKRLVYSEGYHGHHDEFVSLQPPALGCVAGDYIRTLPKDFNDISCHTSAIIVEPIMTELSDDRIKWLRDLREYTKANGIVLIFDEIITGFRFPKFTVSNYLGIEPDLICLGKAIANGLPLSVVGGKTRIMNCGEYFVSSTFAGETLSLAAGLKTTTLLQNKYRIADLWAQGERFLSKFNTLWPEKLKIEGYPTRGVFKGDEMVKALFWQECIKAGILFGASWFFNFEHHQYSDQVLDTCDDILKRIKVGSVSLEGELPKSPFAQRLREQTK